MAIIKISELRPVGSELFQDSESFLNELNDQETSIVSGGTRQLNTIISVRSQVTVGFSISIRTISIVFTKVNTKINWHW